MDMFPQKCSHKNNKLWKINFILLNLRCIRESIFAPIYMCFDRKILKKTIYMFLSVYVRLNHLKNSPQMRIEFIRFSELLSRLNLLNAELFFVFDLMVIITLRLCIWFIDNANDQLDCMTTIFMWLMDCSGRKYASATISKIIFYRLWVLLSFM